jgi:hypothetical protein
MSRGSRLLENISCTTQQTTIIHFDDGGLFISIHNFVPLNTKFLFLLYRTLTVSIFSFFFGSIHNQ